MRRRQFLHLAATAAALPWYAGARAESTGPLTALVGGLLIDGSGSDPVEDSVILLEGDRISAVGTIASLPVPAGAERVALAGLSVLPGLWDMNVHLSRLGHAHTGHWDENYLPLAERVVMPLAMADLVRAGVTSVRDIASPLVASLAMRRRVAEGYAVGPGVYVGGPALAAYADAAARPYQLPVSGVADARSRTAELVRDGVDFVVVREPYSMDAAELAAIVAAAHAAQTGVHALVVHDLDLAPALAAGVDGLIGIGDGTGPWPEPAQAALRERMATGKPLVVAATMSPLVNYAWLARNHAPLDDPRAREGWPEVVATDVRGSLDDAEALASTYPNVQARRDAYRERVALLLGAGVLLVAGSGAGEAAHLPARATWQEVEALVREAGLTPLEAIRRATYWPAVACGVPHESGTIMAGKYADLLAVRGDVARDIDRLADVEIVYRHGRRVR